MKKAKLIKTYPAIWETIDESTSRRKVPGGWLVFSSIIEGSEAMCFLADPKFEWIIVKPGCKCKV